MNEIKIGNNMRVLLERVQAEATTEEVARMIREEFEKLLQRPDVRRAIQKRAGHLAVDSWAIVPKEVTR